MRNDKAFLKDLRKAGVNLHKQTMIHTYTYQQGALKCLTVGILVIDNESSYFGGMAFGTAIDLTYQGKGLKLSKSYFSVIGLHDNHMGVMHNMGEIAKNWSIIEALVKNTEFVD